MSARHIILTVMFSLCMASNAYAVRDDVLIIVNDNSNDSASVGSYYSERRDVPADNIVHVRVPASYYISWDKFRSMRDQIIKHMQAHTLDETPISCVPASVDSPYADTQYYCSDSINQIRAHSRIRYVVMTKGIPAMIDAVTDSHLQDASGVASVDNYLRFWLVNYYTADTVFSSLPRSAVFEDGRGIRQVIPEQDKELIIGRIDGVTLGAANALVDRAIAAEENGVYGTLFGVGALDVVDTRIQWMNYKRSSFVYPKSGLTADAWRYQFGLWGETNNNCTEYEKLDNYLKFTAGSGSTSDNAPSSCSVVISNMIDSAEEIPGTPRSRAPLYDNKPLAVNALVYMGYKDGQSTGSGESDALPEAFEYATNWRRTADATCSVYCSDDACRNTSTDAMHELNTDCVGVADGFVGHNLQSFPAAGMYAWPTGWHAGSSGASVKFLAFPEVRENMGYDDNYSLWFGNPDQVDNPQCYSSSRANGLLESCIDERLLQVYQTVPIGKQPANGAKYKIRIIARGVNLDKALDLKVSLLAYDWSGGGYLSVTGSPVVLLSLPSGTTNDWIVSDYQTLTISTQSTNLKQNIRLKIESYDPATGDVGMFKGSLGLDDLEIREIDNVTQTAGDNIALNPTLTEGHHQVSGGDFPSMFLSRMNGAAFWGSMSHHVSGGHSFEDTMMERLIYWMRGLPLGDAVWFGEGAVADRANSGILYGDPLYSPVDIHLDYANNEYDFVSGIVPISGSASNGTGLQVSTSYRVDYCAGDDFYVCDRTPGSWSANPIASGVGRQVIGEWDTSSYETGDYVLRLAATSINGFKEQTFYDYYPVTVYNVASDYDGDGLLDQDEMNLGINPHIQDTDGDTLSDYDEVLVYYSDPKVSNSGELTSDADLDGIPDFWETTYGSNPLVNDSQGDLDNDGVNNVIEYLRGTLGKPGSTPIIKTIYVDRLNISNHEDGLSPETAFTDLASGIAIAQDGDTVEVASGEYSIGSLTVTKSLKIKGPQDRSAVLNGTSLRFENARWGGLEGLAVTVNSSQIVGSRNISLSNMRYSPSVRGPVINASSVVIRNALIVNPGPAVAGLRIRNGSDAQLINSTITGFPAGVEFFDDTDVVGTSTGTASIRNSILMNTADFTGAADELSVNYSLISDRVFTGIGNLTGDPLFVDSANGDYSLQARSNAIDAGDWADSVNLEPSPNGCRINMGADGGTAAATTSLSPCGATIWFDDDLPDGASGITSSKWTSQWVSSNPTPLSGARAYQSSVNLQGTHDDVFDGSKVPLALSTGESIFAYVYLKPTDVPEEVMLSWHDIGGNWEHRAYWGENKIGYGKDGTDTRRYMGTLPVAGGWVRLEVPASAVGLEGRSVSGMGFSLFKGSAYWDYVGKVPATDTAWFDDGLPTGASGVSSYWTSTWVSSDPAPFSGNWSYKSSVNPSGTHDDSFDGNNATLALNAGESLYVYVYLNPANVPDEVMLSWHDVGGNWEHRAYWGQNKIGYGVDGTNSRRYMGALPTVGKWVRLEVPASAVGLDTKNISGMGLSLFKGSAYWDYGGKSSRVTAPPPPWSPNIWFDDALPAGAASGGNWSWVASDPTPYSGSLSYKIPNAMGAHGDYFDGNDSIVSFEANEGLRVYVYLDPSHPPKEVMLSLRSTDVGGSWNNRVYWGEDRLNYSSQINMGGLPATGGWAALNIPPDIITSMLAGKKISGMSFTLYDGAASFDYVGKY